MSRKTVFTCEGCGVQTDGTQEGYANWRRVDVETFYLHGPKRDVANVDLCPACTGVLLASVPDLHEARP
jgi:hypothetical protein